MDMENIVIGIDLGTTNSCASYYVNGQVEILENAEGGRLTPSCVFFTKKTNAPPVVGQYAKSMSDMLPENGIYEIKRFIGRKFNEICFNKNLDYFSFNVISTDNGSSAVVIDTRQMSPEDISALILKKIKNDVEAKLRKSEVSVTVNKAVITVPAYFNTSQREATLAAANQAGFTVLKLLNEPTAAALTYYFRNTTTSSSHSLVFDLGGGTLDVAILKTSENNIQTICVDGDTSLGGKDFDNVIVDYVCKELIKDYNFDPKKDRRAMRRLQNKCEEAKKQLSVVEDTTIVLDGFVKDHQMVMIELTKAKFETMAKKIFKKAVDFVHRCVKNSKLETHDIKDVILCGGSTRIPKIQQILSDYFDGRPLNKFVNPDECVAEGAALQAAMLSLNEKQKIEKIRMIDVVPLSLGTNRLFDAMEFVLKKNTVIPCQGTLHFTTVDNLQSSMLLSVYEGERSNVKYNRLLGELTIENLTKAPPGQCSVIVTFIVDANGILTVKAKERFANNVKELKINYSRSCRSDAEVEKILQEAKASDKDDQRFIKFADLKSDLHSYCKCIEYNLESKNLVYDYKTAYELCINTTVELDNFELTSDNELRLEELIRRVKEECEPIRKRHHFRFMNDISLTYE